MLGSTIGYVLFPYVSKNIKINWSVFVSLVTLSIIVLSIVLFFAGIPMVSFSFSTKYDNFLLPNIAIYMILLGIIQCVHTILHFYIYAVASRKQLNRYIIFVISLCIFYFLTFKIIDFYIHYNFKDIILHILFIWVLKILYSLFIIKNLRYKNELQST